MALNFYPAQLKKILREPDLNFQEYKAILKPAFLFHQPTTKNFALKVL
jgi:hypothetical protein